jgi:23S rRNA (cytosine1962-C5)-methyltransferase
MPQRAVLNPKEERRLLRGHPWVYRNEFSDLPELEDGSIVDVYSAEKRFVGRGFFQAQGGIAVRLLSRHQEDFDTTFFARRLETALTLRRRWFGKDTTVFRWVHAESDGLPGLVIDRYNDVVVISTSCRFYEKNQQILRGALGGLVEVSGVLWDTGTQRTVYGNVPPEIVCTLETGVTLGFTWEKAQKTGLFLDQRSNAAEMQRLADGARVFDGHCYVGLWTCHAARAGAAEVTAMDTSEAALDQAKRNAEYNGVSQRCRFERGDVLERLPNEPTYDLVFLDPPALAKARSHVAKAVAYYEQLNARGLRALRPGGWLITSSCSHFVDIPLFLEILKRAARTAQRNVQLVALRGAAADHPIAPAVPETAYLKCAFLRVI